MNSTDQAAVLRFPVNPPGTRRLRIAFLALWAVDLIAASLFFLVPYAIELNPITVFLYELFGLAGVPLAAGCYAGIVVLTGNVLDKPRDLRFLVTVTLLYVVFVVNNLSLLFFGISPLGL